MRIDRLEIENFKKYEHLSLDLHPQFTLLCGENGSGKTTILDALAVASSVWLHSVPDLDARRSKRDILGTESRTWAAAQGDRLLFRASEHSAIYAAGLVFDQSLKWSFSRAFDRYIGVDIPVEFETRFQQEAAGEKLLFPVLALYGAERGAKSVEKRDSESPRPSLRWAAFKDCFDGGINAAELTRWFRRESIERGNRKGRWRPGFDVVRRAVLRCVPGATDVRFDGDRDQIILEIDSNIQPFDNLSAGQRMMLALVADLAIKCVMQNAYLIPPDELAQDGSLPEVLQQTPGLVLIDELDVHLHPRWQRRIAKDLKETFPSIQFVCTSHSPQIIGELTPEEIRILDGDTVRKPARSFGIDSSRILEELMDAPARDPEVDGHLKRLFHEIDQEDFSAATRLLPDLEGRIGKDDPELVRARALMDFLQADLS